MNSQNQPSQHTIKPDLLSIIVPGFLVAATGVGTGDLATASFAGCHLDVEESGTDHDFYWIPGMNDHNSGLSRFLIESN